MAADLCSILFLVDFSNQCVLAARHVKTEKLSAALKTLHVNEMFSNHSSSDPKIAIRRRVCSSAALHCSNRR